MHVNNNICKYLTEVENPRQNSLPDYHVHSNVFVTDVFVSGNRAGENSGNCQVLPTLLLPIRTKKGIVKLRALLDTGSTSSFVVNESLFKIPHEVIESGISLMIRSMQGTKQERSRKVKICLSDRKKGGYRLSVMLFHTYQKFQMSKK